MGRREGERLRKRNHTSRRPEKERERKEIKKGQQPKRKRQRENHPERGEEQGRTLYQM